MTANKYRLTRLNDGLVKEGTQIVWINYKLTGNAKYKHPAKGRGLVIFRGIADYWQTTRVQSFIRVKGGTILFTTENSNYKLEKIKKMKSFETLIENVIAWAADKDILKPENSSKQMLKVMEEVGETAGALAKNKEAELKDGIGDVFVTLIILAKQMGMEPADCLEAAWNEIKNRTGKTVNGVFIKD